MQKYFKWMLLSETISFKGTIEDLKERVAKEQSFYRAEWITEHKIKFAANSSFGLATKILIIADDMGKDATAGFEEGSIKPNTPHLDNFKNSGLSFTNYWVYPTCTPTRSSLITGKYGYRTGVINVGDVLNSSETILQKYMNDETGDSYATAIVGKWHLSGNDQKWIT